MAQPLGVNRDPVGRWLVADARGGRPQLLTIAQAPGKVPLTCSPNVGPGAIFVYDAPEEQGRGRKNRFREEPMSRLLRAAAAHGTNLALCRTDGIAEQPFAHWRRTYQGLGVPARPRLQALASEHAQRKRLGAEHA